MKRIYFVICIYEIAKHDFSKKKENQDRSQLNFCIPKLLTYIVHSYLPTSKSKYSDST